jgi:hypothetical protein
LLSYGMLWEYKVQHCASTFIFIGIQKAFMASNAEMYFVTGSLHVRMGALTLWSRVLPEELTGPQLVKKFPAFYGTQRFITTFTSARHLSPSWARVTESMPPHHSIWRSVLILSSHLCLGLPSGLLPSGLPN